MTYESLNVERSFGSMPYNKFKTRSRPSLISETSSLAYEETFTEHAYNKFKTRSRPSLITNACSLESNEIEQSISMPKYMSGWNMVYKAQPQYEEGVLYAEAKTSVMYLMTPQKFYWA